MTILAYLDPGTGSILLQFLIGSLLGGLIALKLCWQRVTAFLFRWKGTGADDDSSD